jgi:hypothetical protein
MTEAKPKRHWLRFSLRTMFVAVTAFACWLGWQVNIVHQCKAILDTIGRANEGFRYNIRGGLFRRFDQPTVPFWREWLGDAPVLNIALWEYEPFTPSEIETIKELFPEAHVTGLPRELK